MIDIHTHILPEMDDGSKSVEETIKMFSMMVEQEVDTVVATPHFYIDGTEIDEFLKRREACVKKLIDGMGSIERPYIALGAEVQFFPEMHSTEGIDKLCISGTRYMLVEMPFDTWNSYTYKALGAVYAAKGITPIIAHVERYFEFQDCDEMRILQQLKEANVLIQVNSTFLTQRTTKRKALKLIKKGFINFMGSDCHNTETRPPELRSGFDVIYEKLGEDGLSSFAYWEDRIIRRIETF